ncbi:hypothetical protein ACE4RR_09540 [Alteribacillus sp. HJP-4]
MGIITSHIVEENCSSGEVQKIFASISGIVLFSMSIGASVMYTKRKQMRISLGLLLLCACLCYAGFFLSSFAIFRIEESFWIVTLLRTLAALSITAAALFCFSPVHGFYHSESSPLWIAVAIFSLFIGWEAGIWFSSFYMLIFYYVCLVVFFFGGSILQSFLQQKWRRSAAVVFVPFGMLLFFACILLI